MTTTIPVGRLVLPCEVCRKPIVGRHGGYIVLDHDTDEWHIFCSACDPHPGAGYYWFPAYRVADPLDLLDRTASMLRTGWLGNTDFGDFLHRIVRANNQRGRP